MVLVVDQIKIFFKMRNELNNKSQIFMLDLIFSIVLIFISLSLFYNYYYTTTDSLDVFEVSKNIQNGFSMTKINSLNDKIIVDLFVARKITNIENSIIQQIILFYNSGQITDGYNLTKYFVKNFDNQNFLNINMTLKNDTDNIILFNQTNNRKIALKNAEIVSVRSRKVFANKGDGTIYGPYTFEVTIWK